MADFGIWEERKYRTLGHRNQRIGGCKLPSSSAICSVPANTGFESLREKGEDPSPDRSDPPLLCRKGRNRNLGVGETKSNYTTKAPTHTSDLDTNVTSAVVGGSNGIVRKSREAGVAGC